ncbi:hypothetical protein ACOMHN_035817 [Nucella lapillus]
MESIQPQFVGAPCGSHGPYTFFKAVKFKKDGNLNILKLGEFFYFKILDDFPICIGEIQLLWEEKGTNQLLTSVRLYFQPQDTPGEIQDGSEFGEDEVLAMSEKLIVSVEDLVVRLLPPTTPWAYGRPFRCYHDLPSHDQVIADGNPSLCTAFASSNLMRINFDDVEKERQDCGVDSDKILAPVAVMTYPRYCRYRTVLKRVGSLSDAWLKNILVMAIGGITSLHRGLRVMFCREAFEYRDLEDLEFHLEHLAPNLKGRPRKRKMKRDDSDSNGYGSDHSSNASSSAPKIKSLRIQSRNESRNGITGSAKGKVSEEEKVFLKRLYKFMATHDSPIDRLPSLGFKQIDLYEFYRAAKRLGGYQKICENRQWKYLYDELGGHASSTSAATCTRRHYERLILPYENHLRKQARQRGTGQRAAPNPAMKDAAQNTQPPVHNGQLKDKGDKKESIPLQSSQSEAQREETKQKASCAASDSDTPQDKAAVKETTTKKETNGIKPLPKPEDQTRASTATNTGTETPHLPAQVHTPSIPTPQPPGPSGGAKVFKVEDLYQVEMKPTFVQRAPPLEVPLPGQPGAATAVAPSTTHKQASLMHHPHHKTPTPHDSLLKPLAFSSQAGYPPSSPLKSDRSRKQPSSSSIVGSGSSSGAQQPLSLLFDPLSANSHPLLPSQNSVSPSFSSQVPMAHQRAMTSLFHHLNLSREHMLSNKYLSEALALPLSRDPHVLASQPTIQSLQEPAPAHTTYVKACIPPDYNSPHLKFMPCRTHKEMRTNPVDRFPHPNQVLSRIHIQHQRPASESKRSKAATAPSPSPSSSTASSKPSENSSRFSSSLPGASLLINGKDSGGHSQGWRVKGSSQSGPVAGSSKNHYLLGPGGSSSSGGPGSSSHHKDSHMADRMVDRMAEALQQQQQQQQSEVLLQSALFGAQFTALPRPAQPADAVSAYLPSLLTPHHAAFALGGQAFPASSAASPLSMYGQLTPAAQAQLMAVAYSEEIRHKALLSSPFVMASLQAPYTQPPLPPPPAPPAATAAKDSSSSQK